MDSIAHFFVYNLRTIVTESAAMRTQLDDADDDSWEFQDPTADDLDSMPDDVDWWVDGDESDDPSDDVDWRPDDDDDPPL